MNINRKLVYVFALLFTAAFAVVGVGAPTPPETSEAVVTATPVTTEATTEFTAEATLEDSEGNKLNGYEIEFTFKEPDGTVIDTKTDTTGDDADEGDGEAKVTFTAPETVSSDYSFEAYFAGTSDIDYDSDTAAVDVEKAATALEVRPKSSPDGGPWLPHQEDVWAYESRRHPFELNPKGNRVYLYTLSDLLGGGFS